MATLDKEIEIVMLKGETGGTIDRLEKTATVGNVDTYTIYMTDGSTYTFNVTNGTSISTIEKTATVGNVDTYTITLTDGSTTTFQVKNGEVTLEQFRVFESELEDFCDDFEQQIDVIDNDINNQTTGLKNKVLNIQNYLNNANLNLNEILSLINNTTSDKSNWLFTPKYSYHNFEVGIDTDDVLEAVIKQLCIDYPNKQHITFFGNIEPNSTGIYFLHIYNTSDLTNGLPRYSMGLYVGKGSLGNFGTWEYSFSYVNIEEKISTLENKHLYRHDIKITRVGGGAYSLVFSLYLTRSTSITTMTDLVSYIGNSNHFNANGTWVATNNSIGLVDEAWTSTSNDTINVSYCYINNGDFDHSNGSYNTSTAVISDKVTQVF